MDKARGEFDRNVFINGPFDPEYRPLLRAMLFTVLYCELFPRIATESADSGEVRVKKIVDMNLTLHLRKKWLNKAKSKKI